MTDRDRQLYRSWTPHHGAVAGVLLLFLLIAVTWLAVAALVYAQESAPMPPGVELNGLLAILIPAVWGAVGPVAMAALTKLVNRTVGAYVPRPAQVILSSVFGAVMAGVTGDASTAVGAVSTLGAAVTGGTAQLYAAIAPERLRTSPPPATVGGPVP